LAKPFLNEAFMSPTPVAKQAATSPSHESGTVSLGAILPEEIEWKPFAAFPPPVRLAVLVGDPTKSGPYVIRVKVPHRIKLMPHRHPEDRIYTVISGVFYIGVGDEFEEGKLAAYPPGAVVVLPGNTHHFHWAKSGEYVTQVTAMGPLGLEYVHSQDDPRIHEKSRSRVVYRCNTASAFARPATRDAATSVTSRHSPPIDGDSQLITEIASSQSSAAARACC
jgi:quercetin dioxygenase-like cupin family protein